MSCGQNSACHQDNRKRNANEALDIYLSDVVDGGGWYAPGVYLDCERLSAEPHRLSGTPEYNRAADYVLARLRLCPQMDH